MADASHRVHPAARGFDSAAEEYERGRPDYPEEALRCLSEGLELGPSTDLLELASGTGKLTRGLVATGARIVAVEPSEGMRAIFRRTLPQLLLIDGTAEAIPRPDASADAVVVGQAFHWFRARDCLAELRRVLRPRGRLGLIWNRRDESVAWVREFTRLLESFDRGGAPDSKDASWEASLGESEGFEPPVRRSFSFRHVEPVERVVDRALSVSFIALKPPEERAVIAREVLALLERHETTRGRAEVDFPYRTDLYLSRRLAA